MEEMRESRAQRAKGIAGENVMKKNVIRFTLCAMLYALCFSAEAQQTGKVFRIGIPSRLLKNPEFENFL